MLKVESTEVAGLISKHLHVVSPGHPFGLTFVRVTDVSSHGMGLTISSMQICGYKTMMKMMKSKKLSRVMTSCSGDVMTKVSQSGCKTEADFPNSTESGVIGG